MDKEFEAWLRGRHLKSCLHCQRDGKARLVDGDSYALWVFREFYADFKTKTGKEKTTQAYTTGLIHEFWYKEL